MVRNERYLREFKNAQKFNVDYFIKKASGAPHKIKTTLQHTQDRQSHPLGRWGYADLVGDDDEEKLRALMETHGFITAEIKENMNNKHSYLGKTPEQRIIRVLQIIKVRLKKSKRRFDRRGQP